jgi:aspartate aminotransferase-like enzyme
MGLSSTSRASANAPGRVGAALVVDAIQSLGAHPFDVDEVGPDFLVASAYKWLLGPYGWDSCTSARSIGKVHR